MLSARPLEDMAELIDGARFLADEDMAAVISSSSSSGCGSLQLFECKSGGCMKRAKTTSGRKFGVTQGFSQMPEETAGYEHSTYRIAEIPRCVPSNVLRGTQVGNQGHTKSKPRPSHEPSVPEQDIYVRFKVYV